MAKTLTSDGEEVFVSFPIEKTETNADGDVIVYGKATDGSVDSDMQVVDPEWSAKALQHWLKTGGNLRVMHNGQRDPAGKGLAVEVTPDGHYVKALVVEPVAKELVKKGVLRAYSVGIVHPKIDQDPTGKAMGGIIRGGPLTEISELSLVDRPANRNCQVQLVKRAKDGTPEVSGKVFGEHDLLGKMQTDEPSVATEVNVSLPDDVTISFTPNDLAKILNHRGGVAEKKRNFDPNVGGGVDRAKLPSKDFAGRGRSFPIVTPADVSDAAQSIGRAGASNYSADKLKANIIRIARRKGAEFVAQLPESWKSDVGKAADADLTKEPKDQKKPFPGAKEPFGKKDDADEPDTEEKDDTDESPAEKAARKAVSDILGRVVKNDDSSDDEPDDEQDTDVDDDADGHDVSSNAGNTETSDEDAQGDKPKADKSAPSPADGVKGHTTKPVPSHREPDGPDVEALEHDMKIPTDPDAEFKAAQRHKAIGIDHALGTLHDLTCPAYDPAEVAKSYPTASLSNIDVNAWQQKAMDAAASAPFDEANRITRLWQHAVTIKGADPRDLEELQWVAHKAFQDANPGPTKAPTPCELSPKKFNRPYLSAGHSAASPGHDGPNTAHVPTNDIAAAQFERGYESAGRAADSPGNVHTRTGVSTPATTGKVGRVGYENLMKDNAAQAMRAMHDHIAQTFPDVCAIGPNSPEHAEVKHPVPTPAGTPSVSAVKSKAKLQARLTDDVLKGKLTIDEAIKKMMTEPADEDEPKAKKAKKKGKKGKKPFPPFVAADAKDDAAEDDDKVGKAMTGGNVIASQAIAELQKQLNEATKMLKKQAKVIDELASQPDTSNLPFRGAVSQYNSQLSEPLGGVQKMAAVQDRTQLAVMAQLEEQFRTSPDPAQREAAWSALTKMRGIPT